MLTRCAQQSKRKRENRKAGIKFNPPPKVEGAPSKYDKNKERNAARKAEAKASVIAAAAKSGAA